MRLSAALAVFAAFAVLVAQPVLARTTADPSSHSYYRSSDGSAVHGPTQKADPNYGKVTATCRDGTSSYSHHHSGTCSGHGGVGAWK